MKDVTVFQELHIDSTNSLQLMKLERDDYQRILHYEMSRRMADAIMKEIPFKVIDEPFEDITKSSMKVYVLSEEMAKQLSEFKRMLDDKDPWDMIVCRDIRRIFGVTEYYEG